MFTGNKLDLLPFVLLFTCPNVSALTSIPFPTYSGKPVSKESLLCKIVTADELISSLKIENRELRKKLKKHMPICLQCFIFVLLLSCLRAVRPFNFIFVMPTSSVKTVRNCVLFDSDFASVWLLSVFVLCLVCSFLQFDQVFDLVWLWFMPKFYLPVSLPGWL